MSATVDTVEHDHVRSRRQRLEHGRIAVEPLDVFTVGVPLDQAGVFRQLLLTDEAFFGPRDGGCWGYAIVSYFGGNTGDKIDQPPVESAFGLYLGACIEILADFAQALVETTEI